MATKVRMKKNNPPVDNIQGNYGSTINRTPAFDQTEARDILSMITGSGATSLSDKENQVHFKRLTQIVGEPMAQKLATQAFLYNQRPETRNLKPEQRVQGFFDLGSNDPSVSTQMKQLGGIGYGVADGFRNSPLFGNSLLQGKAIDSPTPVANAPVEKIKLLVRQNMK